MKRINNISQEKRASRTLKHSICLLLSSTAFFSLGVNASYAQDVTEIPQSDEEFTDEELAALINEAEGDDIVVVGSRISGVDSNSNVIMFDRTAIDRTGLTTVTEILQRLPQSQPTLAPSLGNALRPDLEQTRFNNRASGVNLRGLGERSTLILINGRRIASSAATVGGFSDVSAIPLSAVERIEVLTDGAAAIYGADAVGGVINIVMVKEFDGGKVRARYGNSSSGGDDYSADLTYGFNRDRLSSLFTLSYNKEKAVRTTDYGNIINSFERQGFFGGALSSFAGAPAAVEPFDFEFLNLPFDTAFFNEPASGQFLTQNDAFDAPTTLDLPLDLGSELDSYSLTGNLSYALTDRTTLFTNVIASYRETMTLAEAPRFFSAFVPFDNPFSPFNGADGNVPEDVQASYVAIREVERGTLPYNTTDDETLFFSVSTGFEHSLAHKGWKLKGEFSYSADHVDSTFYTGVPDQSFLIDDALADPDPATSLNLFGDGSAIDPVFLNSLFEFQDESRNSTIWHGAFTLDGELVDLPGGALRFASGIEYRSEGLELENERLLDPDTGEIDSNICLMDAFLCDDIVVEEELDRTVFSAFAELSIPIIGNDNALPLVDDFSLSGALRYENHDDTRRRTNFSPSVGFRWTANDYISFRGNYNESFRTPPLDSLAVSRSRFLDSSVFLESIADFVDVEEQITGGNPNLDNERAQTFSLGTEIDLPIGSYAGITLNYFNSNFENRVGAISDELQDIIFANPDQFPEFITVDGDGNVLTFINTAVNLGRLETEGLDFSAFATFDLDKDSMISVEVNGVKNFKFDEKDFPGANSFVDRLGNFNGVQDYNLNGQLSYIRGGATAVVNINYNPSYEIDAIDAISISQTLAEVNSYTTVDLQLKYDFNDQKGFREGLSIVSGVTNIFDEDPPFAPVGFGVNFSQGVDPRRRIFFVEISKEF